MVSIVYVVCKTRQSSLGSKCCLLLRRNMSVASLFGSWVYTSSGLHLMDRGTYEFLPGGNYFNWSSIRSWYVSFFFSPTGYANKLTHVFCKKFKGVVHAGRICRKNISYSLAPVQTETSGTTQYRTKHMIGHLNRDHKHFQITLTWNLWNKCRFLIIRSLWTLPFMILTNVLWM